MILEKPHELLYVEPQGEKAPYNQEVKQVAIRLVQEIEKADTGGYNKRNGSFIKGKRGRWRGCHQGPDGITSSNCDYLLSNGQVTNSIAHHYLAHYYDRLSPKQAYAVGVFCDDFELSYPNFIQKNEHREDEAFPDFMNRMNNDPYAKNQLFGIPSRYEKQE